MNEDTALGGKNEDTNVTNFFACTALQDERKLRGLVYQDTPFLGKKGMIMRMKKP
ncbi:MAG: hypothetical protein NPIRA03_21750 [Nitrospirales bacterium]|nr:MAG: hypothetical protein NPIRA03_21750 [Nitrospirales bacterium]